MELSLVFVRCQEFDKVWTHVLLLPERYMDASFFIKLLHIAVVKAFDCNLVILVLQKQMLVTGKF